MHLNFPGLFILLLVPYAALPQAKKPIVVSKCRRTRAKPSWDVRIQPWFIGSDLVNRVVSGDAGSCVSSSLFSCPPCFQLISLSHACVANTFANCVGRYLHFGFGLFFSRIAKPPVPFKTCQQTHFAAGLWLLCFSSVRCCLFVRVQFLLLFWQKRSYLRLTRRAFKGLWGRFPKPWYFLLWEVQSVLNWKERKRIAEGKYLDGFDSNFFQVLMENFMQRY